MVSQPPVSKRFVLVTKGRWGFVDRSMDDRWMIGVMVSNLTGQLHSVLFVRTRWTSPLSRLWERKSLIKSKLASLWSLISNPWGLSTVKSRLDPFTPSGSDTEAESTGRSSLLVDPWPARYKPDMSRLLQHAAWVWWWASQDAPGDRTQQGFGGGVDPAQERPPTDTWEPADRPVLKAFWISNQFSTRRQHGCSA